MGIEISNGFTVVRNSLFYSDGSSLLGWVTSSNTNVLASTASIAGIPSQTIRLSSTNNSMRRDLGEKILNKTITFDFYPTASSPTANTYNDIGMLMSTTSGGGGSYVVSLRMVVTGSAYKQGLSNQDNGGWLYIGDPAYTAPETTMCFPTHNTWYNVKVQVSPRGSCCWYVNNRLQSSSAAIPLAYATTDNANNYFGFLVNNLNGTAHLDNIKVADGLTNTEIVTTTNAVVNLETAPSSGTIWTNTIGNSYSASLKGSTSYTTDMGGGIVFNDTDEYISVNYDLTNSFTVESVAKFDATQPYWCTLWGNESYTAARGWMAFQSAVNQLAFTKNGSNAITLLTTTEGYYQSNINHIVASYDSTTQIYKVYLNGVLKRNITGVTAGTLSTTKFNWGARHVNDGSSFTDNASGTYYQLRIYDRQLSDLEVLTNFNAVKGIYGL